VSECDREALIREGHGPTTVRSATGNKIIAKQIVLTY
jgi:hypothetical protein